MPDTPEQTLEETLDADPANFDQAIEAALEADAKPMPEPQPKEEVTMEEFTTQTGGLAAALLAIQADMPAIEKNAVNPHYKSKYTTLDHLIAKALPICRRHNVLVTQWPTTIGGTGALCTRLTHVPTGESWENVMPLAMAKEGPQEQGSCLTYAKRYALGAVLCVSTEEDDDANTAEAKPKTERKTTGTPETATTRKSGSELTPAQKRLYAAYKKAEEAGIVTADQFKARLKDYGVRLGKLTDEQVPELIAWLNVEGVPI